MGSLWLFSSLFACFQDEDFRHFNPDVTDYSNDGDEFFISSIGECSGTPSILVFDRRCLNSTPQFYRSCNPPRQIKRVAKFHKSIFPALVWQDRLFPFHFCFVLFSLLRTRMREYAAGKFMEIFQLFDLAWSLFSQLPLGTFANTIEGIFNRRKELRQTSVIILSLTTILALATLRQLSKQRITLHAVSVIKACHFCTI